MAYVNNPSIPAFPVSTQTEVKTAITNIANWIIAFNTKLGDTIGEYNGYGTANYSSSLLNFVQKAMTDDKVVYNTLQKLTSRITESHLTTDLNTRINLIDDPDTGLIAKLEQEVTDRTNAILAEQEARIEDILNEVEDRNAAILVETNARIDSDESLASQITTLVSTYDNLAAVVDTEIEARAAADTAEASSRETLATQIRGSYTGTNLASLSSGLLYSEREARTTADSSEVSARQLLSSKVIGTTDPTGITLGTLTSGLIYDEKTARSTADSAEVTARQSLTATLSGYNDITGKTLADISTGIIAEEKTARATADSANATSISTLSSQVNNATTGLPAAHSAINQINTVSSTSTSTNAKALFSVKSAVEDPSSGLSTKASVTQLTNAITTLDTALSQDITQLNTTVDNNTSSIETLAQVTDGIQAEYTVKLNTNNKIAGFGLMLEEGEPSTFEILANRFAVVNTDGVTSTVPFFVEDSNVYMNNAIIHEINADNIIANGTIKSPSIQGGSLNGTTGTFTGSLIAATGTFAGTLSAGVVDLTNTVGQSFTYPNAGNYTVFTMPYIGTVRFTIVGGGGGGAGGNRYDSRGGGGYAGSVTTATITNVPMGTSISVSIGAGGSAGVSGTNGGAGGTTSININGYNYTASGGAGGTVGNMINNMTVYYHTNDYGDFAATSTSAGNAASYSGSIGGARGGSIFGTHWVHRCAAGDPSTLNGGAGIRGGGGGGGAATNVWVGNRGFYIDPVDGDSGDGLPPSSGGVGGTGFAFIEIWNPNGVVLYEQYKTLVTWLNGTSIGPVPAGAL